MRLIQTGCLSSSLREIKHTERQTVSNTGLFALGFVFQVWTSDSRNSLSMSSVVLAYVTSSCSLPVLLLLRLCFVLWTSCTFVLVNKVLSWILEFAAFRPGQQSSWHAVHLHTHYLQNTLAASCPKQERSLKERLSPATCHASDLLIKHDSVRVV